MSYTIKLGIAPLGDPSTLLFTDESTNGGETVTSRDVNVIKSDLSSVDYPFIGASTTLQLPSGTFDRDYALQVTFTTITNVSTYTVSYKFILIGYANLAKKNRIKRYQIDNTIEDKELYKKNTLDINYYILVANDEVAYGNMIGAQKALDRITDIILKDANSPFSY